MNTRLNPRALTLAGASAGALLVLACFAIYAALQIPDPWMPLFLGSGPTPLGWLVGTFEGALIGGLIGLVVAQVYNGAART